MCYLFLQNQFWTRLTIVMIYGFLYSKLLPGVGAFHLVPNIVNNQPCEGTSFKDQSCYFINLYHSDEDWFQIGKSIFKTQDSTINNHSQESLTASSNGVFKNSKQQILYSMPLKSTYSKCSKQSRLSRHSFLLYAWEGFWKPIAAAEVTTVKYLMHLSVFYLLLFKWVKI